MINNSEELLRLAPVETRPYIFTRLVQEGGDVNYVGYEGITPLMSAAAYNPNPEVVKILLKLGANVNASDYEGYTALMYALQYQYNKPIEVIKHLINYGADIDAYNDLIKYPIIQALRTDTEVLKLLVENHANLEVRDNLGYTPLMIALKENLGIDKVKLLLKAGANLNVGNYSNVSLLEITFSNFIDIEVIKLLLSYGLKKDYKNSKGETLLDLAAKNYKNVNAVKQLQELGFNYQPKAEAAPKIKLDLFKLARTETKNLDLFVEAIKEGEKINSKNSKGQTPLMIAAIYNKNPQVIKQLIKLGANVNAEDNTGSTVLILALENNSSFEIIQTLIKFGANINIFNHKKEYPLNIAIKHNNTEAVKLLLALNVNRNIYNSSGQNPMKIAIINNANKEILQLLKQAESNKNKENTAISAKDKDNAAVNVKENSSVSLLAKFDNLSSTETTANILLKTLADIKNNLDTQNNPMWILNVLDSIERLLFTYDKLGKSITEKTALLLKYAVELMQNAENVIEDDITDLINSLVSAKQNLINSSKVSGETTQIKENAKVVEAKPAEPSKTELENIIEKLGATDVNSALLLAFKNKDNYTEDQLNNIKILIEAGADVNVANSGGWTPLHFAVRYNNFRFVQILIEILKANVNATTKDDSSILYVAIRYNSNLDIIKLLTNNSAKLSTPRYARYEADLTAAQLAVKYKISVGTIKYLIDREFDLNNPHKAAETFINLAEETNDPEIIRLVKAIYKLPPKQEEIKAEPKAKETSKQPKQENPLFEAVETNNNAEVENIIQGFESQKALKLASGFNINTRNAKNQTALMVACSNPKIDVRIIKTLLKYKAKVNLIDNKGNTALHYAVINNLDNVVIKSLIDANARIDIPNVESNTAFALVSPQDPCYWLFTDYYEKKNDEVDEIEEEEDDELVYYDKDELGDSLDLNNKLANESYHTIPDNSQQLDDVENLEQLEVKDEDINTEKQNIDANTKPEKPKSTKKLSFRKILKSWLVILTTLLIVLPLALFDDYIFDHISPGLFLCVVSILMFAADGKRFIGYLFFIMYNCYVISLIFKLFSKFYE